MCLAVPAKAKSVLGQESEVEIGGVSRAISPGLTPEAQPDDCVHVHTGNGINVVDGAEALEGLRLPQERVEGYWPDQLDLTTGDLQAQDRRCRRHAPPLPGCHRPRPAEQAITEGEPMPTHDSQWLSRRTRLFCGAGDDGRLQPSGDEVVPTYRVVYARGREITR